MELSDKEFSMIANALVKECSRLESGNGRGRDMFNNTHDDYCALIGRVLDEGYAQHARGENE